MFAVDALGSVYASSLSCEVEVAISSLVSNSHIDINIVLVVDGPIKSELESTINRLANSYHITLVRIPTNCGLGYALAVGLLFCTSDYVLRFDTDDVYSDVHVKHMHGLAMLNPSIDVFGTYVDEFVPSNFLYCNAKVKKVPLDHASISRALFYRNPFNHPSILFKRSSIVSVGGYEDCRFFEDYFLWLKCKKYGLRFQNSFSESVLMRRVSLHQRRSGLRYFYCELAFSLKAYTRALITLPTFFLFLLRAILRLLLPPGAISLVLEIWRERSRLVANPVLFGYLLTSSNRPSARR